MTRSANGAALRKLARGFLVALLAVAAALYAAGYYFLWWANQEPYKASPLTVLRYWYHYGDRPQVRGPLLWSVGGGFGTIGLVGVLFLIPRKRSLHGDARFAKPHEVKQAGLLADSGIILGKYKGRYLTLGGQQGVLLAAPPRSGKGVGVVIPNLLNFPGSVVCIDVKRENFTITAGFRARHGQSVYLFDPFSPAGRSHRWNPLGYVDDSPARRIDDIQRIAAMLYPDAPGADPFWTNSSRTLFLGIALYLFERRDYERLDNANAEVDDRIAEVKVTLGEVLRHGMATDEEGFAKHWKRTIDAHAADGKPLSEECVRALYDVIDLAPVTASSVRKTFTSRLDLWLNPLLDAVTSGNDFDLRELRKRPMTIYVAVNPDDVTRLQAVLNMFFQQVIGLQTRELPEQNPALKHQVLILLDEFTILGKIPIFTDALAFVPGYNVRTLMVIQTPAQLRQVYGQHGADIMLKTLAARVVYAPKDIQDAREISGELGNETVKSRTLSKPSFGSGKGRSVNVSDQPRALLLPQEVKEISREKSIVFYEGVLPLMADKIRYYEDKHFMQRLLPPPLIPLVGLSDRRVGVHRVNVVQNIVEAAAAASNTFEVARPVAAADMERLDAMELDDFAVTFDDVVIPASTSDDDIRKAVDTWLDDLVES